MITIDGSIGEGGGQVLRTSLALAMITGTPVRLERIRAGRAKPGLLRQHLTSVHAAREVCAGDVSGAELGSSAIEFHPGAVRGGEHAFAIGTAGSTTLVLQTVLPALMLAGDPSTLIIEGGTHNTHAPSVDFLTRAFLPLVERMGPRVRVALERHGFYPAGGGRIRVEIDPADHLRPIDLLERGAITHRRAEVLIAGLPPTIAIRELAQVANILGWGEESLHVRHLDGARGPGNVLSVEVGDGSVTEVFTGFGERGVRAEQVASNTVDSIKRYLLSGVPVWEHLADQLMVPLALAGGGSFRTGALSRHADTNAEVIERFLPVKIAREQDERSTVVRILP